MARTLSGTILLLVLALVLVAGCTSAVQAPTMMMTTSTAGATAAPGGTTAAMGTAAPTVTLTQAQQMQLGQELFGAVCVCHPTSQLGAPSVAQVASMPQSSIEQTVRSGRGAMPMWDTQQLSQQWLTYIVNYIMSTTSGTPMASGTPMTGATSAAGGTPTTGATSSTGY